MLQKRVWCLLSIALLGLVIISGCINDYNKGKDNNKGDVHYIYVMYSEPMAVNTTVYVNDELVINLTNKTFCIYPPISEMIELDDENVYNIEVYEKNLSLYLNETISMNGDIYISVFITKEKISIKTLKEEPEFE